MAVVGLVGLGLLGHAVAARLAAAGHAVVGYDVVPDRAAALTALGGKAAGSAADVAARAEAVFTSGRSSAPTACWPARRRARRSSR